MDKCVELTGRLNIRKQNHKTVVLILVSVWKSADKGLRFLDKNRCECRTSTSLQICIFFSI